MNNTSTSSSISLNDSITYTTTSTSTNPYLINTGSIGLTPYTISVQDVVKSMEELKRKNNQPIKKPSKVSYDNYFAEVIEHVPNKVYEFIFYDNKHIKTVCQEEDEFDFDYAFYLAIAKHIWSKELTFEGVLKKTDELRTCKVWVKRVKNAKREFFKKKEEELKAEVEKERIKEQHKKYIAKKKRRNERRAAQAQDNLQKLITEAIKAAKEGK